MIEDADIKIYLDKIKKLFLKAYNEGLFPNWKSINSVNDRYAQIHTMAGFVVGYLVIYFVEEKDKKLILSKVVQLVNEVNDEIKKG